MADNKLIKKVQSTFSMYGFTITRDISAYVLKQLQHIETEERDTWMIKITDQLTNLNLQSSRISLEHIKQAIRECIRPEDALDETETIFNIINMHDIPKVVYNVDKQKFILERVSIDLLGEAAEKPIVLRDRLTLLKHITMNQEMFAPRTFGDTSEKYELTAIEELLSNSKRDEVYVMGILSQITEGQFYLEDTGGAVKLDLRKSVFQPGLITEGSIVIANGIYDDGFLRVKSIGLPPSEHPEISRIKFGVENTFGGPHKISLKLSEKLKIHEQSHSMDMIVFLSDVWLDNVDILDKLTTIMSGYSDCPPVAFVFCGHFLSFPPNVSSTQKLKEGFDNLAKIIQNYPDIQQYSKFIFVPGPHDLGAPKILPRSPLPKTLLNNFLNTVPGTIFASNPCKIQYCTKEIVVLREDILTKLCRNTLRYPERGNVWDHYARSIISQCHLAPMNLPVIPVYWRHDHALRLYPTPDLIVVADQFQPYTTSYNNCKVINPGMFLRNNFSFKVYKPGIDQIEECEVPNEID